MRYPCKSSSGPLPSEQGTTQIVSKTFTFKPRPDSGRDCALCETQSRHNTQSRPEAGLGFEVKVFRTFSCVPNSLDIGSLPQSSRQTSLAGPPSRELGAYQTVRTGLWPWISGIAPSNDFLVVFVSLGSGSGDLQHTESPKSEFCKRTSNLASAISTSQGICSPENLASAISASANLASAISASAFQLLPQP